MGTYEQLLAISPLDGRYAERVNPLRGYLSEFGLIRHRVEVMAGWVSVLGSGLLPDREPLPDRAHEFLASLAANHFDVNAAAEVKVHEQETNHDVKAVELWLTKKLAGPVFEKYRTMVHFGCTSEDVNATAYALMLSRVRSDVVSPKILSVTDRLDALSQEWADIPLLSLTHGQPATPTTLGKEIKVFAERMRRHHEAFDQVGVFGKFGGASGGHNAARVAYPDVDWWQASDELMTRLGIERTRVTTQIEPHDWMARYANELVVGLGIQTDAARDFWQYISRGVLKQKIKEGEVGSSTMPHKVNPIDFENAEGNADMAIAVLQRLATSLPVSRMQRDLSDSTRLRVWGPGIGHAYVALSSLQRGLGKISPNSVAMEKELNRNWAVLTEAVQTVMRAHGIEGAYDRIKAASRGQELTQEGYFELVRSLQGELDDHTMATLTQLTPATYLGDSVRLAREG